MKTYDHQCPDCGGQMVLRTNRKTQEKFWGCCGYPDCVGTRAYGGEGKDDATPDEMPSGRYRRNDRDRWKRE